METLTWPIPAPTHRMLARLHTEATPIEMGATSMAAVLSERWRISSGEAHRRLERGAQLGPRRTLSGEPLAPVLAATAAAQARGLINPEHVEVIRKSIDNLPGFVDAPPGTRSRPTWCAPRAASAQRAATSPS